MSEDKFNSELWEQLAKRNFEETHLKLFKPLDQVSIKSVYSKSDLNKLEHTDSTPGVAPFIRGLEQQCTLEDLGLFDNTQDFQRRRIKCFYKKALAPEDKV